MVGTQVIATLIAVYGPLGLMTPIGWGWALLVWVYALAWFLVNDRVKLVAYRIFDPEQPALLATARGGKRTRGSGDSRLTYALPLPSEERAACDPRPSCAEPPISMNASRPVCPRRHFSQET